ncbi:MAG: cbb3-type cytochrome c oxidase subunit I [Verrucomicrobiota bacterium]
MLFALAFLPMFGIGGLTGLPLGFSASDLHLHDTYYVIGHFHYVVAPGTMFGIFAGIYFWYPKLTGRFMNEFWGKVHFWGSLIFMNVVFMPMFVQGMAGMLRRMSDGGINYAQGQCRRGRRIEPERHGIEPRHPLGRDRSGRLPDSIHHQFVLQHQERQESAQR